MSATYSSIEHLRIPGASLSRVWTWLWARIWWIVSGVALAGAFVYFGTPYVLGPIVLVDVVERQRYPDCCRRAGRLRRHFGSMSGPRLREPVQADVPVAEGQDVKAGDPLIQLDDSEANEAVRMAQALVEQSRAHLAQLQAVSAPSAAESKAQALAALQNAQRNFDRALKLSDKGLASQSTLDDARKALEVARSQVRVAELQETASKPGGMDYLFAQTQLAQSEASLQSARVKHGYSLIRATRDGTLIERHVERGSVVQPGTTLMVLAPSGETQIVVQIDEINLGLLQLGQKATASADAYPKQTFEASLSYINPAIDPQRGSVEVKLSVPKPPAYLRQDMTVSVEIEVARRAQAIVVETTSVHELTGAKPWVMVVETGRARRRDIKIGTIGDAAVEVLAGLQPGDVVVRGQSTSLADGQRVRMAGDE